MDFYNHLINFFPKEIVERIINQEGEHHRGLLINPNKISEKEILNSNLPLLKHPNVEHGYICQSNEKLYTNNYLYELGCYYVQDPAAMLVASILPIDNKDIILDMCAAPGGKTIQLAFRNNNGLIISNDASYDRAKILAYNIAKLGIDNAIVTNDNYLTKENIYELKSAFSSIVIDAPCSGSSMFYKDEKMMADWTYKKVLKCAKIQEKLLERGYFLLQNGGFLVYSTCSFSYEENEAIIISFLKKHHMKLIDLSYIKNSYSHPSLKEAIHLYPFLYDGDGQFICLMQKLEPTIDNTILMKKTISAIDKLSLEKILTNVKLSKRHNFEYKGYYCSLPFYINLKPFNVLRPGLVLGRLKSEFVPSYHLARYLDSTNSLALDDENYAKYIKGEEIHLTMPLEKGYYLLSYKKLNVAFCHYDGQKIKNLYPKSERQ